MIINGGSVILCKSWNMYDMVWRGTDLDFDFIFLKREFLMSLAVKLHGGKTSHTPQKTGCKEQKDMVCQVMVRSGTTTDLQNILVGFRCSQTAINKPHQCLPACRSCVPVHQQHYGD